MPHALLLKYPGTNCDAETERALRAAGFSTQIQPIATATPEHVAKSQLVVLGGGFSYGDYVTSGRLAQLETERFLGDALHRHHAGGGLLLGICNGFQILTKLGILPDSSLIDNKKERFECVWAKLVKVAKNSPFLQGLPDEFELPSAHAEGRLVTRPGDAEKYLAAGNVEKLGLPIIKKTKTGYSTDVSVLEQLEGSHPLITTILEHRKLTKLHSTYLDRPACKDCSAA